MSETSAHFHHRFVITVVFFSKMPNTYARLVATLTGPDPEKLPPEASATHTIQQEVDGIVRVEQEVQTCFCSVFSLCLII